MLLLDENEFLSICGGAKVAFRLNYDVALQNEVRRVARVSRRNYVGKLQGFIREFYLCSP